MSSISTHVLDTALGKPAAGIRVTLTRGHAEIGSGVTDTDGRVRDLNAGEIVDEGDYRLSFAVGEYFSQTSREAFYSEIVVSIRIRDSAANHHVPLLLSPFGYSTYRGS
ncbi:MAG: hydroxyisourate hydrolase [Gemmatimonadaceae bacterium]